MNFASIERFGVEGDGGRVATLDTADGDFSAQFDPGHGEDGAGVGAGQREDVLFIVLQQTEDSWEEEEEEWTNMKKGVRNTVCLHLSSVIEWLHDFPFLLYYSTITEEKANFYVI